MTATLLPQSASTHTVADTITSRAPSLWRTGLRAGVIAAAVTTAGAVLAGVAGVSFEVEGEAIPIAGYAQMTLIGAVLGVLLAKAARRWSQAPQRTFVRVCVALTALSCVPDLTTGFDAASALTLMALHVAAAVIIVPRIADQLPE